MKELTGYTRVSAQIRWLRRHGWKFIVNGPGDPIVALAEFNRHMVGGKATPAAQEAKLRGDQRRESRGEGQSMTGDAEPRR
jgi:hypothetical protein